MRILSTPAIIGVHYDLREARELLLEFTKLPGHAFWPTTISYFEASAPFDRRLHGPKQVTDAYLLGLAKHHRGKLATLDKAIKHLAGEESADLVELIH